MDPRSTFGALPGALPGSTWPRHEAPARQSSGLHPLPWPPIGPRHPDCPLGSSLVVSTIALSRWLQPADSGVGNLRGITRLIFGSLVCVLAVFLACCAGLLQRSK